jgi:hypothetical protein
MRKRITRILFAATAAGVTIGTLGFTAASASSTGTTLGSKAASKSPTFQAPSGTVSAYSCAIGVGPCQVGYLAENRDFRYAQAVITAPNRGSNVNDPAMEVLLEHAANEFAAIGVRPCQLAADAGTGCTIPVTTTAVGKWELFTTFQNGSGTPTTTAIAQVPLGTSVVVSEYWNPSGTSVNFQASIDGINVLNNTVAVLGTPYTLAEAIADWRYPQPASPGFTLAADDRPSNPGPGVSARLTQFLDGRFTTMSGVRGSFSGAWTLASTSATSNGVKPGIAGGGTLQAEPSYLWTDSNAPILTGDAFGLWLRGS